jgi:hypothetical protein
MIKINIKNQTDKYLTMEGKHPSKNQRCNFTTSVSPHRTKQSGER